MTLPPTLTPVTRPVLSTVATSVFDDDHVTVRPVRGAPAASNVCATRCTVSPILIVGPCGVTVTDATPGGMTVIVENPDKPPELAAMRTVPTAMPTTTPVPETVAMDEFSVFQKMVAPLTVWPAASVTVAASVTLEPTPSESLAGETVTPALPPPGPVESPPHERIAAAQTSAETSEPNFDRRAVRIQQLMSRGVRSWARARGRARACECGAAS